VRKWLVALVIGPSVAGVVLAVLPFNRFWTPRGSFTYSVRSSTSSTRCPAPIVSAWRHEPTSSGWFGYAPLTSTPTPALESCAEAARRRLAYAGLLGGPGVFALFLRRRRPDRPANPNPNPNVAT